MSTSKSDSESPVLRELPFSKILEISKFAPASHSNLAFFELECFLIFFFLAEFVSEAPPPLE